MRRVTNRRNSAAALAAAGAAAPLPAAAAAGHVPQAERDVGSLKGNDNRRHGSDEIAEIYWICGHFELAFGAGGGGFEMTAGYQGWLD